MVLWGVVQIPLRRKLFLVSPSWCRGCLLSDGVMDVASGRLLHECCPLRLVLGNNGKRRRIKKVLSLRLIRVFVLC